MFMPTVNSSDFDQTKSNVRLVRGCIIITTYLNFCSYIKVFLNLPPDSHVTTQRLA